MKIHSAPMLPLDRVIVFENAVEVANCRLADLRYEPGPDGCVDVFLHPDAIDVFERMFFEPADKRRLN